MSPAAKSTSAPRRHTPIVLAEAIVQLLDEAKATSHDSRAALDIVKAVVQVTASFSLRDDAAYDAERSARDAARDARDAATSGESRPPLSQSL